jgi:hypothetical protein
MSFGNRSVTVALFLSISASFVSAQIDVDGGTQSLVWPANCGTTVLFNNNTGLPLAGIWIGINLDGTTNPPEIRDISVHDQVAGRTWDVDDNEDLDNGDASEADEIDSTPLGNSAGWHRVQARTNPDIFAVGENFTIKLCDSSGGSLSGRTIYLVPMAQAPGQSGGDKSTRTEPPVGVSQAFPTGSVVLDPVNAPPDSTSFAFAAVNNDGSRYLKRLKINPPSGINVLSAGADNGAFYDLPNRTIVWPSPLPPGVSSQVNITVSTLTRSLITTIGFDAIEFVLVPTPVPTLPPWGIPVLAVAGALMGAWVVHKRRRIAAA